MKYYDIQLRNFDATDKNVVLTDQLMVLDDATIGMRNVYLCDGVTPGTGVFPAVGDVDNGVNYGPTGTEYAGTLQQPAQTDVKTGVTYGAGGTEFTGSYGGSGGGTAYPPQVMGS